MDAADLRPAVVSMPAWGTIEGEATTARRFGTDRPNCGVAGPIVGQLPTRVAAMLHAVDQIVETARCQRKGAER
jgi:hypothetical protein